MLISSFLTYSLIFKKMIEAKVISLDRTPERRQKFSEANPKLNFEFFSAVDGTVLSREIMEDKELFSEPNRLVSVGAYGNALSHLSLWNTCINTCKSLTILEDDAIVREDFEVCALRMIASAPQDWDLLVWGWNFDNVLRMDFEHAFSTSNTRFDEVMLRSNLDLFKKTTTQPNFYKLIECWGTPAYSISSAGAKKLKSLCFPLRGVYAIDHAMNKNFRFVNALVAFPPLVVTPNRKLDSTVQRQKRHNKLQKLVDALVAKSKSLKH